MSERGFRTRKNIDAGTRFDKLTVIEGLGVRAGKLWFNCRCDCGIEVERSGTTLRRSCHSHQCEACFRASRAKHGHSPEGRPSSTYNSWASMLARCRSRKDRNWSVYGGRGIRVCERWESFSNFLADMGERSAATTIDRIDNDGHYEPGNCRWAPLATQARNTRKTKIRECDLDAILAARNAGESVPSIAKRYGVTEGHIRKTTRQALALLDLLAGGQ